MPWRTEFRPPKTCPLCDSRDMDWTDGAYRCPDCDHVERPKK